MTNNEVNFFGTDGVRGCVGENPITADFLLQLGWAIGRELKLMGGKRVVIGKDTRTSGYMIESVLEAGLAAAGIDSYLTGPIPTPAIAYLTRALSTDLGIVISASHNLYTDNGVKLFTADGYKISKEFEEKIKNRFLQPIITENANGVGRAQRITDIAGRYIEYCKSSIPHRTNFKNLKIVIDCANGATYKVAPQVFSELGAEVIAINVAPDGKNINRDCGSNHPQVLSKHVISEKADVGIALDGDGDRVIMVDHEGQILNGDELLYIIVKGLLGTPYFSGGVVGTIMSNKGLELAINKLGLAFVRVPVGDQHIIQELRNRNWYLGGEQSGHVIYLYVNTTADGIVTALQVLQTMKENNISLSEARKGVEIFPQKITNIPAIGPKIDFYEGEIGKLVKESETMLGNDGRIVLRYSGTEPVIRLMVEAKSMELVNKTSEKISQALKG